MSIINGDGDGRSREEENMTGSMQCLQDGLASVDGDLRAASHACPVPSSREVFSSKKSDRTCSRD
jgi:hypothetical protein